MDVSVVCPVFDTPPALLAQAARSVLDNAPAVRELILVDDASRSAATIAACDALRNSDARVVVQRLPRNGGPASARNHGISVARGEWIGFLDADDLWAPGRLALAREVLAKSPDAAWIGGGHGFFSGDGPWQPAPLLNARLGQGEDAPALRLEGAPLTRVFIADFCMHLGAMLTRRDLILRAGGFAEGLSYYEDFLMMAKLSVLAPLHYQPRVVYGWRREPGGLTSSTARLSGHSVRMHQVAAADPLLRNFRRELRWAGYSARKGLALNNLLAGRRAHALAFALGAYAMDPREVKDLAVFLGLWARGRAGAMAGGARYSGVERFEVRAGA